MDFDHEFANYLDEKSVSEVQKLEKEIGTTLLAYPERPLPAQVTKEQLEKIKDLEKRLCVRLVAYETH